MSLTADRNTPRLIGDFNVYGLAAVKAFAGALLLLDPATGYVTKGQATKGLVGIGVAETFVDNSGGSAGDLTIPVRHGVFSFANSDSTDEITAADIGGIAWAVDDATVAKTSGSGARSPAGLIVGVDDNGVHVEMGAGVLSAFLKQRKRYVQLVLTTIAGSGSPVYRCISPVSGLITKIRSIVETALTTGDATLTAKIAGTAITGGAITVTQSGSAAGDKDSTDPTAANYVAAGDELSITVTGTEAAAVRANVVFEIDAD
jgi:hypothetical protein